MRARSLRRSPWFLLVVLVFLTGFKSSLRAAESFEVSPAVVLAVEQLQVLLKPPDSSSATIPASYVSQITNRTGTGSKPPVDDEWKRLYGDVGISQRDIETIRVYSTPLISVLQGGLPRQDCEQNELKDLPFLPSPLPREARGAIWDALVANDFLFVNLMFESAPQIKGLANPGALNASQWEQQCALLHMSVTALKCLRDNRAGSCGETYRSSLLADIAARKAAIVADYQQVSRTHFSRLLPQLAGMKAMIVEAEDLPSAVQTALKKAAEAEFIFQRDVAIAKFLSDFDDELLLIFDMDRKQLDRALDPLRSIDDLVMKKNVIALSNAASSAALAALISKSSPLLVGIRQKIEARISVLQSNIDKAQAAVQVVRKSSIEIAQHSVDQIPDNCPDVKERARMELAALKSLPSSGITVLPDSNLPRIPSGVGEVALHLEPKPNGKLNASGQPLYDVALYLINNSTNMTFTVTPGGQGVGKFLAQPCLENPIVTPRGERLDLKIIHHDMLAVGDGRFIPDPGVEINRSNRIGKDDVEKIMRSLGVSLPLPLTRVSAEVSDNVQDVTVHAVFSPFPGQTQFAMQLALMKGGRVQSAKDLRKEFNRSAKQWLILHANEWFAVQPFVMSAKKAVTEKLALVADSDVAVTVLPDDHGFELSFPIQIKSSDPEIQTLLGQGKAYHLKVIVNQQGVHLYGENLEFDRELQAALEQAITSLVGTYVKRAGGILAEKGAINRVLPLISVVNNDLSLGVRVDVSAEHYGCEINDIVVTPYPFDRLERNIADLLNRLHEPAEKCVRELAQRQFIDWFPEAKAYLFGIALEVISQPCVIPNIRTDKVQIRLVDPTSDVSFTETVNVLCNGRGWQLQLGPDTWSRHGASLDKIIRYRLSKLFDDKYIEFGSSQVTPNGYAFDLTLKEVPYLGALELGRIHLSATKQVDIAELLGEAIQSKLSEELMRHVEGLGELPDIGPMQDPIPEVGLVGEKFRVAFNGVVPLYGDVRPRVTVQLIPSFNVVSNHGDELNGLLKQVLGGQLTLGTSTIKNPRYEKIPGEAVYGFVMDFVVNFVNEITFQTTAALAPNRVVFPGDMLFSLPNPIYIGPIVIARPGGRFNFNSGSLELNGDVTVVEASMAHIGKLSSRMELMDPKNWTFSLNGDLVAVDSLNLISAKGSISLLEPRVQYEAGASPTMKGVIEAKASGHLDGPGKYADALALLRLLGVKLADSTFLLGYPPESPTPNPHDGRLEFSGYQHIGLGGLNFSAGTTLQLRDPWVQGGMEVDLAGWETFNGDLWLDLSRAVLNFKALGIRIKVIAPSVTNITPDLLLRILADLLKVDLLSLLEMNLTDITVSLMDADGSVSQPPPSGGEDSNGSSQNTAQTPTAETGQPPEASPDLEVKRNPLVIDETEPGVGGLPYELVCEEVLPDRFEFWGVPPNTALASYHWHKDGNEYGAMIDIHRSTLPEDHSAIVGHENLPPICNGRSFNSAAWLIVAARASRSTNNVISASDCPSDGRITSDTRTRKRAQWYPSHPYRCGTIPPKSIPDYEPSKEYLTPLMLEDKDARDSFVESIKKQKEVLDEYFPLAFEALRGFGLPDKERSIVITEKKDCVISRWEWGCDYHVKLKIYFIPPERQHVWIQSFQLLFNRSSQRYYALSMCDSPVLVESSFDTRDDDYQKYCAKSHLIELAGPENLPRASLPMATHWLTAAEFTYLLEERAGPLLEDNDKGERYLGAPFEIASSELNKAGNELTKYDMQEIRMGSGKEGRRYVATLKGEDIPVQSVELPEGHPLLEWMGHPFRSDALLQRINYPDAEIWQARGPSGADSRLVMRTRFLDDGRYLETVWISPGAKPDLNVVRRVEIPYRNPYTNKALSGDEKSWLFDLIVQPVIEGHWSNVHLAKAPLSHRQVLLLESTEEIQAMFWDIGERSKLEGAKGEWVTAKLAKLSVCLGVPEDRVVELLLMADDFYRRAPGTVQLHQHPFDIMTRPNCY